MGMMWPFKRKEEPKPAFTGNCMAHLHTQDGFYVGRCYYSTYDGICPTHGDVSIYLDDLCDWPNR